MHGQPLRDSHRYTAMLPLTCPTVSSTELLMKALIQLILLVTLCTYINEYNAVLICCELSKWESDQTRQTEHNKGVITGINNYIINNNNFLY